MTEVVTGGRLTVPEGLDPSQRTFARSIILHPICSKATGVDFAVLVSVHNLDVGAAIGPAHLDPFPANLHRVKEHREHRGNHVCFATLRTSDANASSRIIEGCVAFEDCDRAGLRSASRSTASGKHCRKDDE